MSLSLELLVSQADTNLSYNQPSRQQSQAPKAEIEVNSSYLCEDLDTVQSVLRKVSRVLGGVNENLR